MKYIVIILICLMFSVGFANPFAKGNAPAEQVQQNHGNRVYIFLNEKQKVLKEKMADMFEEVRGDKTSSASFTLLMLSFVYGVFHSLGPGHAKGLVSGYLLASPAGLMRSALFGLIVAVGHAMTAFVLVLILYYIMQTAVSTGFDRSYSLLSNVSYAVILMLGLYMLAGKLRKKEHSHGSPKGFLYTAAVISVTPCPGAMVLAMFAVTAGMPLFGLMSVLSMALGMALTICSVAVFTYFVRGGAGLGGRYGVLYSGLQYAGICFLIAFSGMMLLK
jgi:ABC-type nickel/cobalt efflux system permease component RcnA